MDKLIEAILKLFPFAAWLEQAGLSKELSAGLSVVLVAALLWWLSTVVKNALKRWELQKTDKVLRAWLTCAASACPPKPNGSTPLVGAINRRDVHTAAAMI